MKEGDCVHQSRAPNKKLLVFQQGLLKTRQNISIMAASAVENHFLPLVCISATQGSDAQCEQALNEFLNNRRPDSKQQTDWLNYLVNIVEQLKWSLKCWSRLCQKITWCRLNLSGGKITIVILFPCWPPNVFRQVNKMSTTSVLRRFLKLFAQSHLWKLILKVVISKFDKAQSLPGHGSPFSDVVLVICVFPDI